MLGYKYVDVVANKTKLFCQEMQMTQTQEKKFKELIESIIIYTINTSKDCTNAVGGVRQIKNNIL